MILEEMEEALENLLPRGFRIDTDDDGQVVIYTGLTENDDGDLVSLDSDDDDDDDDDDIIDDRAPYDESDDSDF